MIDANANVEGLDSKTQEQQRILKIEADIKSLKSEIEILSEVVDERIMHAVNEATDVFSEQIEELRRDMKAPVKSWKVSDFLKKLGM